MDLLLDTSYLVGLTHEGDAHHEEALPIQSAIVEDHWERVLLHEYVFLETVTVLAARQDHLFANQVGRRLLDARRVEFVPGSQFFHETWNLFQTQETGSMSFVDAALVHTAKRQDVGEIATFDRDFDSIENLQTVPRA